MQSRRDYNQQKKYLLDRALVVGKDITVTVGKDIAVTVIMGNAMPATDRDTSHETVQHVVNLAMEQGIIRVSVLQIQGGRRSSRRLRRKNSNYDYMDP